MSVQREQFIQQRTKELQDIISSTKFSPSLKIGLFGINKHGKSSLIKSFESALVGKYSAKLNVKVGQNPEEPTTMNWKGFDLPNSSLAVYDNRGFGQLTEEVLKQVRNITGGYVSDGAEVNYEKSFLKSIKEFFAAQGEPIDCPIIVWSGASIEAIDEGIKLLLDEIKKKYRAIIVISHGDKTNIKAVDWAKEVNWDADDVFVMRNYIDEEEFYEIQLANPNEIKENFYKIFRILNRCIEIGINNRKELDKDKNCIIL